MHAVPAALCAQFVNLGLFSAPSRNGLFRTKPTLWYLLKLRFFQPLFQSLGDRTVRLVGAVWRPQPHGGEFSTCMADLRRRAVAPVGPVRGPLCALRHMRARSDGRKGARWPRFAIVAVLRAPVRTDVTIFRAPEIRAGSAACGCLG